jgi:alginate O-acetyltransferase complex protein AlgI
MVFTSKEFLIFFTVVFGAYLLLPHRMRWSLLLVSSIYFYAFLKTEYLILLLVPAVVIYFIALKLDILKPTLGKKLLFIAGLSVGLAGLLAFKYSDFLGRNLHDLIGLFEKKGPYRPLHLLLPIGISFYTFKMISYLIDVYRGQLKPERHLGYFALYVSIFPQLFMGPIDRARDFIPELKKKVDFDWDRIISGLQLFSWGLFKKLAIADRLGIYVNEVFAHPQQQGIHLIFAAYFYAFQIYCDFSGYTDMAIGMSRMLGFRSMKNFDFPYFSRNITQFWNRWHISLSTWLRDYLFLPIAYATMKGIKSPRLLNLKIEAWGYAAGMFITMFLGGLWHGASWTFVVWGMMHGFYLIMSYSGKKIRKKISRALSINRYPALKAFAGIVITFNLVSLAWIVFRSKSLDKAIIYLKNIDLTIPSSGMGHLVFNLTMILFFIGLEVMYKNRGRLIRLIHLPRPARIALFALFICLIIIFSVDVTNEFIYFQF